MVDGDYTGMVGYFNNSMTSNIVVVSCSFDDPWWKLIEWTFFYNLLRGVNFTQCYLHNVCDQRLVVCIVLFLRTRELLYFNIVLNSKTQTKVLKLQYLGKSSLLIRTNLWLWLPYSWFHFKHMLYFLPTFFIWFPVNPTGFVAAAQLISPGRNWMTSCFFIDCHLASLIISIKRVILFIFIIFLCFFTLTPHRRPWRKYFPPEPTSSFGTLYGVFKERNKTKIWKGEMCQEWLEILGLVYPGVTVICIYSFDYGRRRWVKRTQQQQSKGFL